MHYKEIASKIIQTETPVPTQIKQVISDKFKVAENAHLKMNKPLSNVKIKELKDLFI